MKLEITLIGNRVHEYLYVIDVRTYIMGGEKCLFISSFEDTGNIRRDVVKYKEIEDLSIGLMED